MTTSEVVARVGTDYLTRHRERNLTTVLRLLKENPPLSRAQLAAITGLNKTTISSLVQELISLNLVQYTGLDTSGGGRPGNLIEINGQSKSAIGIEIRRTDIQAVLIDLTGEILWQGAALLPDSQPPDTAVEHILRLCTLATAISASFGDTPIGVGIGVPGIVDEERGSVVSAPALGWKDVPLGTTIQANVGLPVYVEKSANAAVTGEEFFGVARQSSHVVYVLLDAVLSSGLYLNGSLYRGFDGSAGELEPLDRDLVGQVAAALEACGLARSVAGLGQAAARGQPDVLRLIAYLATTVARRIHDLNRLLNPELIVVGGRFSAIGEALLSLIRDALTEMDEQASVRIELTALGVHGVSTGAATLAVKSFLANLRRTR